MGSSALLYNANCYFSPVAEEKLITDDLIVQAREATDEDLLVVHTRRYLNKLKWSFVVATITEIPPVAFLPNFVVQRKVLRPLRTQTGGTIMAGKLAVDRGWAINVGGGFHHCSSDKGGGFCAYADITLAIKVRMLLNHCFLLLVQMEEKSRQIPKN